jgi:FtsP/CotA-like multicopper oxidase with cupredoxin domain
MFKRLDRRHFLKLGGAAFPTSAFAQAQTSTHEGMAMPERGAPVEAPKRAIAETGADHRIEIATSVIELGKNVAVSTKAYNGGFPGPLLRLTQGKQVVVDIQNNTDTQEQLHWHGQFLDGLSDGATEEGSPPIPARGARRVSFTPAPAGLRFYHTHTMAGADLTAGSYNAQAGIAYIESRNEAGDHDREVFLTLKEFNPFFNDMEMTTSFLAPRERSQELFDIDQIAIGAMRRSGLSPGYGVGYQFQTINGRLLGHGEPIRVKFGERVMLHVVNASATEIHGLSLPNHVFVVTALDGNPVPNKTSVPVLWIGPGERVSAIVEMRSPGVWILGETNNDARARGMGIVVEYAEEKGAAEWTPPARFFWDYRLFGTPGGVAREPDEILTLTFGTEYSARDGFDLFTINGRPFSMEKLEPRFPIKLGRRHRLKLRNATDDVHPVHLHRHSFEITSIAGQPTAGVIKDVAMIGAFQEMTIDFTADQPGLSLFHCHMQHHMDFGFMALFDCN